jgi:outer membrane protein assembly factor BamB
MSVAVLTRSYDNIRLGANTRETVLTPERVKQGLKKLFNLEVAGDDKRLEAQPLIVPGVKLKDGRTRDLAVVATMGNNVWAFDADSGEVLWKTAKPLGKPIRGTKKIDMFLINDHWGILSTPVVDPDTATLYVVSWSLNADSPGDTVEPNSVNNNTAHHLHAIDLADGTVKRTSAPFAATQAASSGTQAKFLSHRQKQRCALLLAPLGNTAGRGRKTLVVACGQFGETQSDRHGWILAFDPVALNQTAAFCTTPNGSGGGVWQAGQGPCADSAGFLYFSTGNGKRRGRTDFGESVVKLKYTPPAGGAAGKFEVADWFTPFRDKDRDQAPSNVRGVNYNDQDLGSAAPLVLEKLGLVLAAGKDGVLYVLDLKNMGQDFRNFDDPHSHPVPTKLKGPPIFYTFFPGHNIDASDESVLNEFVTNQQKAHPTDKTHHLHHSSIFWESPDHGPMAFCWGENENLRAWTVESSGKVTFQAKSHEEASAFSQNPGGMPGGLLTLSANGSNPHTGIVWATVPLKGLSNGQDNHGDANQHVVEGILFAFDATEFGTNADRSKFLKMLWNSQTIPANTFKFSKFCPPVVANGKVYVTTYDGRVDVYGP